MKFPKKLESLVGRRYGEQARLARAIGCDPAHVTRLLQGKAAPTTEQLLEIAYYYAAPMHWLADERLDEMPEVCPAGKLTADELALIRIFRAVRPDPDEAIKAVAALGPRPPRVDGGPPPQAARADEAAG